MTPAQLAEIHGRAMVTTAPWSAPTFEGFIKASGSILITEGPAFVLGRIVADEAEILTLAVDPDAQRQGLGRACLAAFERTAAQRRASRGFLEVAVTNAPARALYTGSGWREAGRRKGYYTTPDGASVDALILSKRLEVA